MKQRISYDEFYRLTFTFYNIVRLSKDPIVFNHLILLFRVNIVDTTIVSFHDIVKTLVYKIR